jgi:hypothetical protein
VLPEFEVALRRLFPDPDPDPLDLFSSNYLRKLGIENSPFEVVLWGMVTVVC